MKFHVDRLMHRAEAPFEAWRLHAAGTQREIGAALAGFALQHHLPSASSDDEIDVAALRTVYARHCPALAKQADGIADCFAANTVQRPSHALPTTDNGPAFACSAAVATGAKGSMLVRNFD
jgi:hypothetical protein